MRLIQITAVVAFTLAVGSADGKTWYVDAANPCPGTGTAADPFCTIQQGLTHADPAGGDFVEVANGTYAGLGNVNLNFWGRETVLYSRAKSPFNCFIDGGGTDRAFVFNNNEPRGAHVEYFTIQNCYSSIVGGAVYCPQGDPTFVGCRFRYNSTSGYGGAVWAGNSGPLFEAGGPYNCAFYENHAVAGGGAVHVTIPSTDPYPEFTDCRFYQNWSDGQGGAMSLSGYGNVSVTGAGSWFVENTAATRGGAMFMYNGCIATVSDCRFEDNDAGDDGGAVFIEESSAATFSACTFPGNTAGDDGGAIYNRDASQLSLSACDFTSNVAASGGGAIKNEAASCEITGGDFEDNEATAHRGGALRNHDGSSAVITDAVFTDNRAGQGGGAVHNQQSTLETSGCSFSSNVAGSNGGAIRSVGATSTAQVTSCDFTGNSAGDDGGAIASADDSDVTVMTDCNFLQNSAGDEGGALASENATANVSLNTDFNGNWADNRGGAIANLDGSLTVSDCTFAENYAADRGGALLNVTSPDVLVDDCTFLGNWLTGPASRGGAISNWESPATITASVFTSNQAILGGGIHNQLQSHAVITDCRFEANSGAGGGIHNAESDAVITDCVFETNTGPMGGGGIFNADSESVISWCQFTLNTTPNTGGGIHHQQANPLISPLISWCDFTANTASASGGGIHISGPGQSFIHNCEFRENVATNTGGGVHCDYFSVVELANCLFADNSAGTGAGGDGGAIRVDDSDVYVANCTLSRNHADTNGGGVSVYGAPGGPGATLDIDNSILWENDDATGMTYIAQIHLAGLWTLLPVDYSCVYDCSTHPGGCGALGPGNIDCLLNNPTFTNPAAGNYHLLKGSPCVDVGNDGLVPADRTDLDSDKNVGEQTPLDLCGNDRFIDEPCVVSTDIVEMGCYERCPADLDGDGNTGHTDLGIFLADWGCTGSGCIGDLDCDGMTGHPDLGILLAEWGCGCGPP